METEVPIRQLLVRMPEEFHRRVKAAAALSGVSLQELVTSLLERWLKEIERKPQRKAS